MVNVKNSSQFIRRHWILNDYYLKLEQQDQRWDIFKQAFCFCFERLSAVVAVSVCILYWPNRLDFSISVEYIKCVCICITCMFQWEPD